MQTTLDPGADLTVLRLSMSLPGKSSDATIACELQHQRRTIASWNIAPDTLGLPRSFAQAAAGQYVDPTFVFPHDVTMALDGLMGGRPNPGDPVWIQLAAPAGTLALVPWERLLQPILKTSVLRLPYLGVESVASLDTLDVVVCASSPVSKVPLPLDDLIPAVVHALLRAGPDRTMVHVFTEARFIEKVRSATPSAHVVVHDPAQAPAKLFVEREIVSEGAAQPASSPSGVGTSDEPRTRNPWLRWMKHELGDMSVDAVHFISHGYMSLERGMLALAESPVRNVDRDWARFVGPHELSAALTELGVWSVGISAPSPNFSIFGLRLLADQLARLRNGAVLLHEMSRDVHNIDGLGEAFHFLYGDGGPAHRRSAIPAPSLPHISISCPPSRTGSVESMERANNALLRSTRQSLVSQNLQRGDLVEGWIASGQRAIERSTAGLLESRASNQSTRTGAERALMLLSNALDQGVVEVRRTSQVMAIVEDAERETNNG